MDRKDEHSSVPPEFSSSVPPTFSSSVHPMVSMRFPWFLYRVSGFHGFHGFHTFSGFHGFYWFYWLCAVSMVSMVSMRFPWFLYRISMVSMVSIGFVRFLWFPWFLCGFYGFYNVSANGDTTGIQCEYPVIFQGTIRQRHVGSRPHSSIEKSAFLCNARLKPWKQYARLRTQLAKRHIRNRDNSVHRLSAVRALNFHRKRSTCVLLTSVGCKRS